MHSERSPNDPSNSPSSSPLAHRSTSPTARGTSAEEGIYDQPIGPEPVPKIATNFSEGQRAEIAGIIAQAITIFNEVRAANPPAEGGQLGPRPAQFRPRDIGFFNPDPQVIPVESKNNYNIYHNVFSFTNRLRVKATSMDAAVLRQNLDACLLGAADNWYTNQLDSGSYFSPKLLLEFKAKNIMEMPWIPSLLLR